MIQLKDNSVVLAIDACGLRGTVALVRALTRVQDGGVKLIGERVLPERNEAATILGAIEELLIEAGLSAQEIGAVLVVDGPGSFTGVRIGVSTALGLSEGLGVPIARISRLAVLAGLGGCEAAVLDAHRGEVYLRASAGVAGENAERLADVEALKSAGLAGRQVAVCNVAVAELVRAAVPDVKLVDCLEPTALDAVKIAWPRILAGEFAEPLAMDGNYLRRSDAEIFSKAARTQSQSVVK
jgi:tRNA threonylcarbamoyladenosine biosynthesis protein TsaB